MIRVALLVSHLSGTGHLVRTLALARALRDAGTSALVISGGRPLSHLDTAGVALVQLPPLSVPGFDFSAPVDAEGRVADAAYFAERIVRIEGALHGFAPDALVTETWPLGRRRLSAEFEAAIAAAHSARPGVTVIGSVRDVPEPPGKPARLAEAADRLRRFHRLLLVHGDADFLDLSVSWPLPADLLGRVVHTGYIGSPTVSPVARTEEVLVSVGGGVLGRPLLALAAQAAMLSDRPWRLLTGGADAAEVAAALAVDFKRPGLTIEPPRADYRRLLAGAACSVSLAGYNTVMDLAACDTPAILVPFEAFGEREQRLRADRLAGMPGVRVLSGRSMSPKDLARAVAEAAAGPRRPVLGLTRDGAARAAEIMIRTVQENA